jgi:protein-S-isoprenylcysteine O-methyltransferase Ste14
MLRMTVLTDTNLDPAPSSGRQTLSSRFDLGRLLMTPVIVVLLSAMLLRGVVVLAASDVVGVVGAVLIAAFYSLMLWAYLNRSRASATSSHWRSHVAAVVATYLTLTFPILPAGRPSVGISIIGDALLLAGSAWSVWALRTLGRSFSILAQARAVVTTGPYRMVRHPLYFGEVVGALGVAVHVYSIWSAAVWVLLVVLQLYRSGHEERVLASRLPDYVTYQQTTKRMVPGLL